MDRRGSKRLGTRTSRIPVDTIEDSSEGKLPLHQMWVLEKQRHTARLGSTRLVPVHLATAVIRATNSRKVIRAHHLNWEGPLGSLEGFLALHHSTPVKSQRRRLSDHRRSTMGHTTPSRSPLCMCRRRRLVHSNRNRNSSNIHRLPTTSTNRLRHRNINFNCSSNNIKMRIEAMEPPPPPRKARRTKFQLQQFRRSRLVRCLILCHCTRQAGGR